MKKKIIYIIIILSGIFLLGSKKVSASYNYKPGAEAIESALSMSVSRVIDNVNMVDVNGNKPNISFETLSDVAVFDNTVYVVDAKANKIFLFNDNFEYLETYPSIGSNYTLNQPEGIYVKDNLIYIADTENFRIVVVDMTTKETVQIIDKPDDEVFNKENENDNKPEFRPQKIVVDRSGRLLVVAKGIFEGIMEFDPQGNFARYYGTNTVTMTFLESLVYKFSTQTQRKKMSLKLQTQFTSIDIDDYGYIYTVANQEILEPVKKLNFKGNNIMMNNGYLKIIGDNLTGTDKLGPSSIMDITVNSDNNRFSILDAKRGRIFTYDIEGHLLYISGELGSQNNMLQSPTSIQYLGEKILVTSSGSKSLLVFEPTEFGNKINLATKYYYEMNYDKSKEYWEQVIQENSNYFLAYAGIGKSQLRDQDWENAIINLKRGHDQYNYSKAYEQYRNIKMRKILPYVLIGVFALSGFGLFKSIKKSLKEDDE